MSNQGFWDKVNARMAALRAKQAEQTAGKPTKGANESVRPTPEMLGSGMAADAARNLRDRRRKIDEAVEAQTR
jgi:hypothetical protein